MRSAIQCRRIRVTWLTVGFGADTRAEYVTALGRFGRDVWRTADRCESRTGGIVFLADARMPARGTRAIPDRRPWYGNRIVPATVC